MRGNVYQLTLADLDDLGPVSPLRKHEIIRGQYYYYCPMPLCGECVGIENDGTVHRELGFIYKRDICRNGHKIDWSENDKGEGK